MKHLTHRVDRVDPREYTLEEREVSEERSVARDALFFTAVLAIFWVVFAIILPAAAHADEGNTHTTVVASYGDTFTVVDRHNVVISSTLRHCPLEDGGPRLRKNGPCTWNVPTVDAEGNYVTDGNELGLSYVMYSLDNHRAAVYVWAFDPTNHGWVWLAEGGRNTDCVFKPYKAYVRCADGKMPIDHPRLQSTEGGS